MFSVIESGLEHAAGRNSVKRTRCMHSERGGVGAYGDVIAHKVPVALLGVELHGEAAHIPQALG